MANATTAHEHHGLGHIMPVKTLLAVWGALIIGTILTVAAVTVDFGPKINLLIALVIATVKASFVVLYFMHLKYDRRFNLLIFMGSLLFVLVFISFTIIDSGQYQPDIAARQAVVDATQ